MIRYVHDAGCGVFLQVTYHTEDDAPTVTDIRVLDGDYRPTGPDLTEFLNRLVYISASKDGSVDGERFISTIIGELTT